MKSKAQIQIFFFLAQASVYCVVYVGHQFLTSWVLKPQILSRVQLPKKILALCAAPIPFLRLPFKIGRGKWKWGMIFVPTCQIIEFTVGFHFLSVLCHLQALSAIIEHLSHIFASNFNSFENNFIKACIGPESPNSLLKMRPDFISDL